MKLFRNNLKVIIAFLLGLILAGGIVYAATPAKEVTYTTDKNAEIKNVAEALNDLYKQMSEQELDWDNVIFNESFGTQITNRVATINLDEGIYIVAVNMSWGLGKGRE